jgi:hypothetical protein
MIDIFNIDKSEGYLNYLSKDILWVVVLGVLILPIILMKKL